MTDALRRFTEKHSQTIKYLFFGALTTGVNFIAYFLLYNFFELSAAFSNAISWLFAVCFAFVTNKIYVFDSKSWNYRVAIIELGKFLGCRLFSGFTETAILYVMVDILQFNGNIWKIIMAVFVIIANYFASKFFVFHK